MADDSTTKSALKDDFKIEYAKSNRSSCKHCRNKIEKESLRIGILEVSDKFDGEYYVWHHVACFFEKKKLDSVSKLKGFELLRPTDQPKIKKFTGEDDSKKRKAEDDAADGATEKKQKTDDADPELAKIWEARDMLEATCNTNELKEILELNSQPEKGGKAELALRVADGMIRGAIPQCPSCKKGALTFEEGEYRCHHHATEWSKCTYTTPTVERIKWKNPKWFAKKKKSYEKIKEAKAEEESDQPIFEGITFFLVGKLSKTRTELTKIVKKNGGTVATAKAKLSDKITFVITNEESIESEEAVLKEAAKLKIPVLRESYIDDCIAANKKEDESLYRLSLKSLKKEEEEEEAKQKQAEQEKKKRNRGFNEEEGKMKVVKKGRAAVDSMFEGGDDYHVLDEAGEIFNVILNSTDITVGQRGRNSFYALQLVEHDSKPHWVVFKRWGRVGQPGNCTKKEFSSKADAKEHFEETYLDKTGNEWSKRKAFVKQPGKFYPIEIDYGDEQKDEVKLLDVSKATGSKLDPRVQTLLSLIFDIELMKHTLLELEIDVKKMPLGKLSKSQIKEGYQCLTKIQNVLDSKTDAAKQNTELIDLTNKFYTLIPQDFGDKKPPIINSAEMVAEKIKLLETLSELEIATSLLKGSGDSSNAIDESYKKLNTEITPLDKNSELYALLEQYAVNTHDSSYFSSFKIIVEDIFEVKRHGEDERFKKWANNPNRMLLWHGSRLTNWGGILSQGLRIAPPEAPKTGYRFGKGIYFADIISKSGSYCFASPQKPTGLMILNEVALGVQNKLTRDQYMEKAPPGTDSTMALGHTAPDPKGNVTLENGCVVPKGKPIKTGISSSCSHNEYIVYDTSQVWIRYLLKIRFY